MDREWVGGRVENLESVGGCLRSSIRKRTWTDVMLLNMLISTEILIPRIVTPCGSSPLGGSPYLGATLVGMVNLRPSTSASCFSSMIYSISILTVWPGGTFPMLVLKTSG